jgi:two-component system response regulator AtoC
MKKKFRVLVVDDEEIVRSSLSDWLHHDGYEVDTAPDGLSALEKLKSQNWHVLLVDLKMPDIDGLQVLRESHKIQKDAQVIIMTAYSSVDTAVQAMKDGAYDYIVKPFDPEEVGLIIKRIVQHQQLIDENIFLKRELQKRYRLKDIIGKSPKMHEVFELLTTAAPTRSIILIQGESGTGKEIVASAIHEMSPRHDGPFVAVACGTLTETLLESELFGHEKGAFTGATSLKKGRFEMADGGTLFLDEVADIGPKSQLNLLRVLEEMAFTRVGGTELIKVDVRIIAATNKNLEKCVQEGNFREDHFYRLNVISINLPPLRERREDIPLLVNYFLEKYNLETGKKIQRVSEDALNLLIEYDWPGNVRELEHAIERAAVVEKTNLITPDSLPSSIQKGVSTTFQPPPGKPLWEIEKEYISRTLADTNWNIKESANILQIDRVTLYNKIKRYELKKP